MMENREQDGVSRPGQLPDLPISKKQLDKLGDRLRDAEEPADSDLEVLESVLLVYMACLEETNSRLRNIGFSPTGRPKTTITLIEKLRRDRSSSLKTIQDVVGTRIVLNGDLHEQDHARDKILEAFADCWPIIYDRREDPRSGYRAVHVVVKVNNLPVEIQVRTDLQNLWSQFFESLADRWGRDIRYGGRPDQPDALVGGMTRSEIVDSVIQLSAEIAGLEASRVKLSQFKQRLDQVAIAVGAADIEDRISSALDDWSAAEASNTRIESSLRKSFSLMAEVLDLDAGGV